MSWKNTTAGKEFDLDDPHFTTPMSVISGLASGLCERKAAVDATFNTQSWGANQTGQQKLNTQSATVSNMAANIAITHSTTETSAYAANAETFAAPTSWTQGGQTKTYLDYFDNALVNVANLYVNRGGVAYNGFDGLAAAASARADSDVNVSHYAGYTVGTTATSGGSGVAGDVGRPAYVGTFTPMFRADWAVERRDMLEELRYVPDVGSITSGEWSGKNISLVTTAKKIVDDNSVEFTRWASTDINIIFWSSYETGSHTELNLYSWNNDGALVYTRDEEPNAGNSLYKEPHKYDRYAAGDDSARFAWRSVGASPSVIYTERTSRFTCGDEVAERNGTGGNYSYTSCGIIATTAVVHMSYTDDNTGTVVGYFDRNADMDTQYAFCWTSGNVSVWTRYGECYSDPSDSVYADPEFATAVGSISELVYDYLNVSLDNGTVDIAYTFSNAGETTVVSITVANAVYTRDPSNDTPERYAWTATGGDIIYTTMTIPQIGYTTVDGDTITHVTVITDTLQEAVDVACDNAHASPVQNELVRCTQYNETPPTGTVSCTIHNLHYYGMQASSFDTTTWLTAVDAAAATRTVQITGGTGRVTVNSCGDGAIWYDSVNCPTYNIVRCSATGNNDWKKYEVNVGMSYYVAGAFVQEIDMLGDMIQNKTLTVSIFLGMPRSNQTPDFLYSYLHSSSLFLSAAKTYTTTEITNMNNKGGTLIVQSGGTATIANCQVDRVIIEPHGSLVLQGDNATASAVCVLTKVEGGTLISGTVVGPYKTGSADYADKISSYYLDFDFVYDGNDSNTIFDGGSRTYAGTARPPSSNVVLIGGATCTFDHFNADKYSVRVHSGCLCSAIGQDDSDNITKLHRLNILPGGRAVLSGAVAFDSALTVVHSGATCSIMGTEVYSCGMLDLEVHSGGSVLFNNNGWFGGYITGIYDVRPTYIDDGAFFQLKNGSIVANTPQAIFNWKEIHGCPARVELCRFNNNSLKTTPTQGTGVDFHYGWNVIQVTVPTGQNRVRVAQTTAQVMTVDPIKEPLYKGTINDDFYSDDGPATSIAVGFCVCAYKVDGLTVSDKYPQFIYRKFGDDHK